MGEPSAPADLRPLTNNGWGLVAVRRNSHGYCGTAVRESGCRVRGDRAAHVSHRTQCGRPSLPKAGGSTIRLRPSATPSGQMLGHSLFHDAAVAKMDVGELGVGVGQIELDRAGRLGAAATDLRDPVLETVRQIDARAVLSPGYRVADRLAPCLDAAREHQMPFARIDVDFQ